MQFNTKFNIGDSIWYIGTDGCVTESTLLVVHISTQNKNGSYSISYTTDAGFDIHEDTEGVVWWRTRDEILNHIMTTIKARAKSKDKSKTKTPFKPSPESECNRPGHGPGCECDYKESTPRMKSELESEFEKFFTPEFREKVKSNSKTVAKDVVGIVRNELDSLYERLSRNSK